MKVGSMAPFFERPLLIQTLVADFYVHLYNVIRANPGAVGHGREGYFNLLNGEHTLYPVSKEIGRALVALGKATTEEPTTFTPEEMNKYFRVSF
jgi:hypothetical protein